MATRLACESLQQRSGDPALLVGLDDRDRGFRKSGIFSTSHVASQPDPRAVLGVDGNRHQCATVGSVDVQQVVEQPVGEMTGSIEEPQPTRHRRQLEVPLRQLLTI